MLDVELILGGLFTAFVIGYSIGKQLLIFKRAAEIST